MKTTLRLTKPTSDHYWITCLMTGIHPEQPTKKFANLILRVGGRRPFTARNWIQENQDSRIFKASFTKSMTACMSGCHMSKEAFDLQLTINENRQQLAKVHWSRNANDQYSCICHLCAEGVIPIARIDPSKQWVNAQISLRIDNTCGSGCDVRPALHFRTGLLRKDCDNHTHLIASISPMVWASLWAMIIQVY